MTRDHLHAARHQATDRLPFNIKFTLHAAGGA